MEFLPGPIEGWSFRNRKDRILKNGAAMKNTRSIIILMFLALSFFSGSLHAEEPLQLKSETAAWVLGLDPLPADALYYAGKPIQGTINLLLGIPGAILFWGGVYLVAKEDTCGTLGCDSEWGKGYMAVGSIAYVPALIWDAIGGIHGVKSHNRLVKQKLSQQKQKWNLSVTPTQDGVFVTAKMEF
jgi:hypothetical protein